MFLYHLATEVACDASPTHNRATPHVILQDFVFGWGSPGDPQSVRN